MMKNIDGIDATYAIIGKVHCSCIDDTIDPRAFAHIRCDKPRTQIPEKTSPAPKFKLKPLHGKTGIAIPCQCGIKRKKSRAQQALFPYDAFMHSESILIVKLSSDARIKEKITQ